MRVAIVHYWFVGMRGGEKVVEALIRLYPQADLFTHVIDPAAVSQTILSRPIKTSFIQSLPRAAKYYRQYLPLMPLACEQLDLRGYDLVISSESGPAKGVIPPPEALHVCYCHSPMRYLWNMYHEYREESGPLTRLLMPPLAHYLRNWDALSATRVDHFIANSTTVAHRVERYYRRSADVVHPPVAADAFSIAPREEIGDYYLMVGELVGYKRPDLAIDAFNAMGKKLVVIGGGSNLDAIRKQAGPTVSVLGPQPFDVLTRHYSRCRALIFPGEEDFGIVPLEAMASGRPVVAFRRGGATETVVENETGVFFDTQTVEALSEAIARFESREFSPPRIRDHALGFGEERFLREMRGKIDSYFAARGVKS
ncbi:glycosyltransferase [Methylosinus sp. H3A]|uniref:glycosyltransferase n=1 Tax=Methylosinus sp. H3A TaxID=2785786 RepID=UPI0018C2D5D6|nr:glycosyltransferase [Methylosinus sp. H3A]MBG0812007.1 glycosyltransferase [Methylosinus sp. H3A]